MGVLDRVGCDLLGSSFFLGGLLRGGALGRGEARQMGFHLRQAGPTDEVELNRLQRSFAGFAAGVQSDQQAGDQSDVQLDGDAVLTVGDQMAAAENAFEPAEEQFHRPAKTIGQRHEVGVEVEAIGEQPKLFKRTIGLGPSDDDQTHGAFEDVFVVIGAESGEDDVADNAGVLPGLREGPFMIDREGSIVFDARDERRAGVEDVAEKLVAGIAAVEDVKPSRLEHGAELGVLGRGGGREGGVGRDAFEDVERQVQFGGALAAAVPQSPSHAWQRRQDRAIDGGESTESLGLVARLQGHGLFGQFLHDGAKRFGVESVSGRLAERAERSASDAEELLSFVETAGMLQGTTA